jgi:hypothetical protein
MARKRYRLTPAFQERLCAYIRSGGFARVAAEAAGVPGAVFEEWMRRGRTDEAREPYRCLVAAVDEALAQARLHAEVTVFQDHPRDWLRYGPGKETAAAPGWTTAAKPRQGADQEPCHPLLDPRLVSLIPELLQLLTPYPEARALVARFFAQAGGLVH